MVIQTVILAAGMGKRMFSELPKVLHPIAGRPMLAHVLERAHAVSTKPPIVIFGHGGELVKKKLHSEHTVWVEQDKQLGTGHAVLQAMPHLIDDAHVLILYGDVPLIKTNTLENLIKHTPKNGLGMLTAVIDDPTGYGRIKRDENKKVVAIVEEKDASESEKRISEINTGIYFVPANYLKKWLPTLKNDNAQHEYYLTDIVKLAVQEGVFIHTEQSESIDDILGVNNRMQQAHMERTLQKELADNLMKKGVTLLDPNRLDIRGEVTVGKDVTIDVNVILEGKVIIGDHCSIGANCILKNVTLKNHVEIKPNSMLEDAVVGDHCQVGPFARIRPGTELASHVHIGNFVEIKKSHIDEKSKVNHLTYIGDSEIGKRVNVGAGTITCNYDGVNKNKTIIEDDVFIGSITALVAPLTIGKGATIGAGSTIAKGAPAGQLTLTRAPQVSKDWKKP